MLGGERLFVALSFFVVLMFVFSLSLGSVNAQNVSGRTTIRGGRIVVEEPKMERDRIAQQDSISLQDSLKRAVFEQNLVATDSLAVDSLVVDSLAIDSLNNSATLSLRNEAIGADSLKRLERESRAKFFSDSMSLSAMCWRATGIPGYGQIYNKQSWKLPILYGSLAAGITLFVKENQRYKPLKAEYDVLSVELNRSEELNTVQAAMIRSNTRRQFYIAAMAGTFIGFLSDAALNYSTNEVSHIKRATTLATICPGAGQIYNKQYWKVPIVIGGFGSLIYVFDWNNRGYQRFKTAYRLKYAYENGETDTATDEFGGQYSATYLKSIRQSYRRSRDLSIVFLAALYVFQIIDAHVDAHFKDYDISDDLAISLEPTIGYGYSPEGRGNATYGLTFGAKF